MCGFQLSYLGFFYNSVLYGIYITELFTLCTLSFLKDDKNKDVQSIRILVQSCYNNLYFMKQWADNIVLHCTWI